jgi:hypothetical protein
MGASYRGGIGLTYRPARLHRLAEFIPGNRFLGFKIRALDSRRYRGVRIKSLLNLPEPVGSRKVQHLQKLLSCTEKRILEPPFQIHGLLCLLKESAGKLSKTRDNAAG